MTNDVCDQIIEEMDMYDISWDGYPLDSMGNPQFTQDIRGTMFTVRDGDKTFNLNGYQMVGLIKERYPDASLEQIKKYLESVKKCADVARTGKGSLMEANVDRILAEMELSGVEITDEKRAEIYQAVKKYDKYDARNEELHQDEVDRDEKRSSLRDGMLRDSNLAKAAVATVDKIRDKRRDAVKEKRETAAEDILGKLRECKRER